MEIKVQDWNDNETVNFRVILLRGLIIQNNQICTDAGSKILCRSEESTEWPVVRGCFKCLAKLKPGENEILLEYGELSKSVLVRLRINQTRLCVCPVYIVCEGSEGRFQAPPGSDNSVESACRRISLGLTLVQTVFAEKLREHGFGRKSFQLETDLNEDAPQCRVFKSTLSVTEARKMDEHQLWETFGREIMCSDIGNEESKYLAFLSCTHWDGNSVSADPALGGGGLALLGSASLHTWPLDLSHLINCFSDETKMDSSLLDNSGFRGTYGGCFNTSLGAVCHEMGHMFNLGHSTTGIMSRGFDHIGRVFVCNESQKKDVTLVPSLSVVVGTVSSSAKSRRSKDPVKIDDHMTHLTKSCATILAHHKWFNDQKDVEPDMRYDSVRNVLTSEKGLKVVQLRASCGAVVRSWELGSKAPHKHLILPKVSLNPTSLIAIDTNGNILSLKL